jgi:hypothetical protein
MAESDFQEEPPQPRPRRPKPPPRDEDDLDEDRFRRADDDIVQTFIPYKNPKSLVAYYCGVFSLICGLGLVLGPIALIFGILAWKYSNRHPTAGGLGHAITGVILGALTSLLNYGALILIFVGAGAAYFKR